MRLNKNDIILFSLGIINLVVCILLTCFFMPNEIPFLYTINEKVFLKISKWFTLFCAFVPAIIVVLFLFQKKSQNLKFFLKVVFVLCLYENMLLFIYFCFGQNLDIGSYIEIPLTAFIFLPLSFLLMIAAIKVKHTEFNSPWGFRFKTTKQDSFVWKQSHFYASKIMGRIGIVLFVISIIFSFFHLWYVVLIIFVFMLCLMLLLIYINSKHLANKYLEMKTKRDTLQKSKNSSETIENENKIKHSKRNKKSKKSKLSKDSKFF